MKISMPGIFTNTLTSGPEARQGTGAGTKDLFRRVLAEVNGQQQQADAKIKEFLLGQADLHEAMLSLEQASLGLKVLVQARNKIIQAYEELSRITM